MKKLAINQIHTFFKYTFLLAFLNLNAQINSFPYVEDFESGDGGWTIVGSTTSWELGEPTNVTINAAASGNNAWVTNLDGDYLSNENGWVQSPVFDLSNLDNPYLEFNIWWDIEDDNGSLDADGSSVKYSLDNGSTWTRLGTTNEPYNWFNKYYMTTLPEVAGSGWTGNEPQEFYSGSNEWVIAQHSLSEITNESNVIFRIEFGSNDSGFDEGFGFDNFKIQTGPYCYAGEDREVKLCINSNSTVYNEFLSNLIIGNFADEGGTWSGDLPIGEFNVVDFAQAPFNSILNFTYTVTGPNDCVDTSILSVEILETTSAGDDNEIDFCENPDVIDLDDYILNATSGGSWQSSNGLTILDNNEVNFNGLSDNLYVFTYSIEQASDFCGVINTSASISFNLLANGSALSVGDNGELIVECASIFDEDDLFGALNGSPDLGGEWSPFIGGAGRYFYSHVSCGESSYVDVIGDEFSWDGQEVNIDGIPDNSSGRNFSINLFEIFQQETGVTLIGGSWSGQFECEDNDPDCEDGEVVFPPLPGGSYTLSYTYTASTGCGNSNTATINFIIDIPFVVGGNGEFIVCDNNPTFTEEDLLGALTGDTNDPGSWTHNEGLSFGSLGVYTFQGGNTGDTANVTVSESLSAGEDGTLLIDEDTIVTEIQLFNALTGSPDDGGIWTPELAGEGTYIYTQNGGVCDESVASVVVTENSLSIDEELLNTFKVYPNPATRTVLIKSNDNATIESVEIYTTRGQLVLKIKEGFNEVDISMLESSIYFLKIKSQLGQKTLRFIKQ